MLFLAGVLVISNSFLVFGQTTETLIPIEQENEYNYSIQEVVDEINQKYDINLRVGYPIENGKYAVKANTNNLTKEEFTAILDRKAAAIAESNNAAIRQFELRTGRKPFEDKKDVSTVESAKAVTANYSKTKEIKYIPVTVTGKVIVADYLSFASMPNVTAEDVKSPLPGGMRRIVTNIDSDLIDHDRTCAVMLDISCDYYDAELGQPIQYDDYGYGEFYASEK